MIIKRIDSTQKRRSKETTSYIIDAENDGEKVLHAQAINCFSENLDDAQEEMSADERAYSGPGNAVAHWLASWPAHEQPTITQAKEFVNEFLKDQNMSEHKAIISIHENTQNLHIHIALLRVKPEPEPNGTYKIQNFGARVQRKNGTSHEVESARATTIDFCKKHGFELTFENIQKVDDPNKIKLGQKIESGEAQTGVPHPKRLIAEAARDIIRAANSFDEMHNNLIKNGISFHIEDNNDPAKYKQWGVLKGPNNERIPLLILPPDCSLKNIEKRFDIKANSFDAPKTDNSKKFYEKTLTVNQVKFHSRKILNASTSFEEAALRLKEKGMRIERVGKTGGCLVYGPGEADKMKLTALGSKYSLSALSKKYNDKFPPHASFMHDSQSKVNASSNKSASDFQNRAKDRVQNANERAASVAAEAIQARTLSEALDDAFAQAHSLDALRKARLVAAQANNRADKAEERAQKAEMALSASQPPKNIEQKHSKQSKTEDRTMSTFQRDLASAQNEQPAWRYKHQHEMTEQEQIKSAQHKELHPSFMYIFPREDIENVGTDFQKQQQQEYENRTDAVRNYLEEQGIPTEDIDTKMRSVYEFVLQDLYFTEQEQEEKAKNSQTDNNEIKKTEEAPAKTLAQVVAEAREKGAFNSSNKAPMQQAANRPGAATNNSHSTTMAHKQ